MKDSATLRARLSAATALAAVGLATTGAGAASAALPEASGHPVGVTQMHLVDHARTDPWTHTGRRDVVVSAFYPARHEPRSPARYVSPALADAIAAGFLMPAAPLRAVRSHAGTDAAARSGRHPVVLVMPGAGLFRSSVTLVAEDLAAHGYVALAIDHPGDAAATERRGGGIRPIAPEFLAGLAAGDVRKAVSVRLADVRFVLDRLQAIDRRGVLRHRLDPTRIAMVGHSLGGSIAANVMLVDRRVDVAINYDGDYFLAAAERAPARPIMTMTGGADDNQRDFFARQRAGGSAGHPGRRAARVVHRPVLLGLADQRSRLSGRGRHDRAGHGARRATRLHSRLPLPPPARTAGEPPPQPAHLRPVPSGDRAIRGLEVVVPKNVVRPGFLGGWWVSSPPVPRRTPDEDAR